MNELLNKYIDYQRLVGNKIKNKDVIRLIKSERFNDSMVRSSAFFNTIQDRYDSFSYQSLTTLSYTDAIINFNPTLVNPKLLSDYILFEKGELSHRLKTCWLQTKFVI